MFLWKDIVNLFAPANVHPHTFQQFQCILMDISGIIRDILRREGCVVLAEMTDWFNDWLHVPWWVGGGTIGVEFINAGLACEMFSLLDSLAFVSFVCLCILYTFEWRPRLICLVLSLSLAGDSANKAFSVKVCVLFIDYFIFIRMVHLLSWEEKQIVFNARGGKCTTKARRAVRAPGSLLIL